MKEKKSIIIRQTIRPIFNASMLESTLSELTLERYRPALLDEPIVERMNQLCETMLLVS